MVERCSGSPTGGATTYRSKCPIDRRTSSAKVALSSLGSWLASARSRSVTTTAARSITSQPCSVILMRMLRLSVGFGAVRRARTSPSDRSGSSTLRWSGRSPGAGTAPARRSHPHGHVPDRATRRGRGTRRPAGVRRHHRAPQQFEVLATREVRVEGRRLDKAGNAIQGGVPVRRVAAERPHRPRVPLDQAEQR